MLDPPLVRPKAVDITSCGNFALVGSSCGRVDVFNMQSGLHRGCYGDNEKGEARFIFSRSTPVCASPGVTAVVVSPAHAGVVRGVAANGLNQLTFTAGSDWLLKFWCFKTRKQEEELKLSAAPAKMRLHRERWVCGGSAH